MKAVEDRHQPVNREAAKVRVADAVVRTFSQSTRPPLLRISLVERLTIGIVFSLVGAARVLTNVPSADCAQAWTQLLTSLNLQGTLNDEFELVPDARLRIEPDGTAGASDLCSPPVNGGYLGQDLFITAAPGNDGDAPPMPFGQRWSARSDGAAVRNEPAPEDTYYCMRVWNRGADQSRRRQSLST